jgi:arylsulfatase A-like enzyme
MTTRPNVLVLMCDQMQAGRMGCAGDPVAHTPFLDSLAAEGARFTHMVSAHGQCVPSRASFITGLPPHECGVVVNYGFYDHQNRLNPARDRTVGQVFREAGYRTAYFGKCHFGLPLDLLGYDEGIDHDERRVEDEEARQRGIEPVPRSLRRDYVAADDAVSWLQDYEPDAERPLFFTFSTNLPHPPFFHEPKYRVDADTLELPVSYHEESFATKPAWQRQHAEGDHSAGDEAQARDELARYYSMIAMMDEHCGRVAEQLRRLGLWQNTVVLFVADHGDMMGGHGISKKGTLPYEELYRVPCIIKHPVGQASQRPVIDDLVSSVQLAGSLCALAGIDTGPAFPHGDFCSAFESDRHPEEEIVFFEHHAAYWGIHPFYGARTRDFKYVRYFGDADTGLEELYHLATDPHELNNVVGRSEHADTQRRLAQAADSWWQATGGRDFAWYESDAFRSNEHNAQ